MRITLTLALLVSLIGTALANPSLPVMQEKWYQIEVLVFARPSSASSEYWRLDQQPDLNHPALIKLDGDQPSLPEHADAIDLSAVGYSAWQMLNTDGLPLQKTAEKMAKDGHRILAHRAWRQPIREHGHAFAVLLEGGDILAEPVAHADDLQIEESSFAPVTDHDGHITTLPELELDEEALAARQTRELQGALRFHLSRYLHVEPLLWYGHDNSEGERIWVKIDQNRRMRSEELHYLDHPLFGLFVRITPWQHPLQRKAEPAKE